MTIRIWVQESTSPSFPHCKFWVEVKDKHLLATSPAPVVLVGTPDGESPWEFVQDRLPSIRFILLSGAEPPVEFYGFDPSHLEPVSTLLIGSLL